jgi:hypothetical protein
MNLFKSFDIGIGKKSRKAAHPLGGVGSSNPRRCRGWRLHHNGDGVCYVSCDFCVVLTRDSSVVLVVRKFLRCHKVIHVGLHHTWSV